MKRLLFSAALMCSISMTGLADDQLRGAGFNAPQVNGTSGVYNPVEGEIVFDGTGSVFYGYDGTNWINLGASATPAGPSTSGVVTSGPALQTFGGNKAFNNNVTINGALTPSGGVVGNPGTAVSAGYVGEKITWTTAPSNQSLSTGEVDWTNASITLTPGVWMVVANIGFDLISGGSAGNYSYFLAKITDASNNVVQNMHRTGFVKTVAGVQAETVGYLPMSFIVTVNSNSTYKIRVQRQDGAGTGSGSVLNASGSYSDFYAVRII